MYKLLLLGACCFVCLGGGASHATPQKTGCVLDNLLGNKPSEPPFGLPHSSDPKHVDDGCPKATSADVPKPDTTTPVTSIKSEKQTVGAHIGLSTQPLQQARTVSPKAQQDTVDAQTNTQEPVHHTSQSTQADKDIPTNPHDFFHFKE